MSQLHAVDILLALEHIWASGHLILLGHQPYSGISWSEALRIPSGVSTIASPVLQSSQNGSFSPLSFQLFLQYLGSFRVLEAGLFSKLYRLVGVRLSVHAFIACCSIGAHLESASAVCTTNQAINGCNPRTLIPNRASSRRRRTLTCSPND